jgi:hypothetical protein
MRKNLNQAIETVPVVEPLVEAVPVVEPVVEAVPVVEPVVEAVPAKIKSYILNIDEKIINGLDKRTAIKTARVMKQAGYKVSVIETVSKTLDI